ncbi:MAG: hypothetical protein A2017_07900 [Lentisphaerae bacterium GWF2_44_16]|nr:MAG: hypothetical protein A2017_07900 [Lentisphaerae bacterium GWF2_44_16]
MKKKILLLNPPGEKIYIRDYYCSKVSKSDYIYHPIDLLIASGWLSGTFELKALDCIAEKISQEKAYEIIREMKPDAIVFLTGAVSCHDDFPFLKKLKTEINCIMAGTGDCLLGNFDKYRKEEEWLDAIILDFTTDDLRKYLMNCLLEENEEYTNIVDLRNSSPNLTNARLKSRKMEIPVPLYELFPEHLYRYPFVRSLPFATVLTSYGCPFQCAFCVMPGIGFKSRSTENILPELDYLKKRGIRDIYFADQTFGVDGEKLKELCSAMIGRKYDFNWVAFTRVDRIIDEELLKLMKKSGCHTLMFGVESPHQHVLDAAHKGFKIEDVFNAFALCRKNKIKTLATFIIGLPGTNYEENLSILDFSIKLDPDYASFNVIVPRHGTAILEQALKENWIAPSHNPFDQSGEMGTISTDKLSSEQILELKNRIEKGFYKRPSYILKRLFQVRTPHEFYLLIKNGISVLRKIS